MSSSQQEGSSTRHERDWGKAVFVFLLAIIPLGVLGSLLWLNYIIEANPDRRIGSITVTQGQTGDIVTTTTYLSPTLSLGAFDPALGKVANYAIGPLAFLIGTIIEMSLLLVFGSFYFGRARDGLSVQGPEQQLVRVFLVIIVSLTILTFAFLPSQWGDNKAVVFLFGLLSTVVGFYFGSQTAISARKMSDDSEGGTGAANGKDAPSGS